MAVKYHFPILLVRFANQAIDILLTNYWLKPNFLGPGYCITSVIPLVWLPFIFDIANLLIPMRFNQADWYAINCRSLKLEPSKSFLGTGVHCLYVPSKASGCQKDSSHSYRYPADTWPKDIKFTVEGAGGFAIFGTAVNNKIVLVRFVVWLRTYTHLNLPSHYRDAVGRWRQMLPWKIFLF